MRGRDRGSSSYITLDGDVVGRSVRTQPGITPVYVFIGHHIDLDTACGQVLTLARNTAGPRPTRGSTDPASAISGRGDIDDLEACTLLGRALRSAAQVGSGPQ
jgi:hypothetical protein